MTYETAMDPEIKAAWLAKLKEVGPKGRAKGVLADGEGRMCCIGWLAVAMGEVTDPCDLAQVRDAAYGDALDTSDLRDGLFAKAGLSICDASELAGINDKCKRFPIREIKALPVREK